MRLRFLILLTVEWVALSLYWVSGAAFIPMAGAVMAAFGQWVSWRWRRSPLGIRAVLIVVLVVGLSLVMMNDFVAAITADRLPIAGYLLLVAGVASFGIRTRGGLYSQMILSGLILYLVGERAFDQTFVGFLIVFLGLFLTFFAMAFMEDQLKIARVHWPAGQLGRFWFWLGIVGGGLIVCSALAFALLPSDYRGRSGSERIGIVPFMGEGGAFSAPPHAAADALGPGPEEGGGAPTATQVGESGNLGHVPRDFGASAAQEFGNRRTVTVDPRDVVMHVRSRVTSYWRGRLFDQFNGETWARSTRRQVQRAIPDNRNFYWHAFFLKEDQPGSVFAGYNPIRIILPPEVRAQGSLVEGSTYSVLSQRPMLTSSDMRNDRPGRPGQLYRWLPPSLEPTVRDLAREIVGDTPSAFEKLWLIASYLRQHYRYDATAEDHLRLSGAVEAFLSGDTPGTSLDFATATVLLARSVGLPARLAVGYLPGKFDPFSGTHMVRRKDAHAWAEINFARHGWVSFDSSPRPELDVFTTGRLAGFGGTAFIFQTRVGGGLYQVLRTGATDATDRVAQAFRDRAGYLRPLGLAAAALTVGWLAFWVLRRRLRPRKDAWHYSRLEGEARREILRTYNHFERLLHRRGMHPRRPGQTLMEYVDSAARRIGESAPDLRWFVRTAWSAAYDPVGPAPELAREARTRLQRLKRTTARPTEV